MNWWEDQINHGWKGPVGQPRGSVPAAFPLVTHTRYRVSMNPAKAHLLMPGTHHAWCGLTLAPSDGRLIDSGYDAYYWIIEDKRADSNNCGDCTRWKQKCSSTGMSGSLPTDSPIPAQEWAATVGVDHLKRESRLDSMAAVIAGWIGSGASVVGKATDE